MGAQRRYLDVRRWEHLWAGNYLVDNNLFIDCKAAVSFSPWGQARWLQRLAENGTQSAISRGGVDITQPPTASAIPTWRGCARRGPQLSLEKRCRRLRGVHRAGPRRQRADGQSYLP